MKALIVSINAKYVHASLSPWYLKAASLEAGAARTRPAREEEREAWQVEVLESNINRPAAETAERILEEQPALLAFCCYIWNMNRVEETLAELAGKLADCRIVLGGPEVSFDGPERLAEIPAADYILRGEGEGSFPLLLKAVGAERAAAAEIAAAGPDSAGDTLPLAGPALRDIPGLCWRWNGRIFANPVNEAAGDPPDPYTAEFLERLGGRIVYLETTRGCPFSCGFCLSGRPGNTRFFDLDRAKRQILLLANSGSKTIKLVDRTFNCDPRRSAELIGFILSRSEAADPGVKELRAAGEWIPAGVCFHFEVAADLFREDSLALLERAPAGLFQLEVGLQSFREETLAAVSRVTDLKKVEENFRRLLSFGNMHLHLDLIAGLPGEDYESFGQSFDRAFALRPHMLQLGFLKLLRGSRLRAEAERNQTAYDSRPPYAVRSTAWLSEEELAKLSLCEDALDRLYNSGRFPRTVEYLLASSRLRPFCLFSRFGRYTGNGAGMPLERYISRIYSFGCGLPGTERDKLRDALVLDWLSNNNTGRLPQALQIPDARYRLASLDLERLAKAADMAAGGIAAPEGSGKSPAVDRKPEPAADNAGAPGREAGTPPKQIPQKLAPAIGSRRPYGFALLYGGPQVQAAVADYRQPRAFLGGYPLRVVTPDQIRSAAERLGGEGPNAG